MGGYPDPGRLIQSSGDPLRPRLRWADPYFLRGGDRAETSRVGVALRHLPGMPGAWRADVSRGVGAPARHRIGRQGVRVTRDASGPTGSGTTQPPQIAADKSLMDTAFGLEELCRESIIVFAFALAIGHEGLSRLALADIAAILRLGSDVVVCVPKDECPEGK